MAGTAGLFSALQEPEAFTSPAPGASLQPTLKNTPKLGWSHCKSCVFHLSYTLTPDPHNSPARQDPILVSRMRKLKLRVFKWLSPGHLVKMGPRLMILPKSCGCDPVLGITEKIECFEKPQEMGGECAHIYTYIVITIMVPVPL